MNFSDWELKVEINLLGLNGGKRRVRNGRVLTALGLRCPISCYSLKAFLWTDFQRSSPDYFLSSSLKLRGERPRESGRTLAGCRV